MRRLLVLLLMIGLSVGNGAAVAAAVCEHADAGAHAAALASGDAAVAAVAHGEEDAAVAAARKGTLSDAASVTMAGFLVPAGADLAIPFGVRRADPRPDGTARLPSRDVPPLLDPPLA